MNRRIGGMTISEQIERDLRAHILVGKPLPFSLTLNGIASHYQVSLMPARRAIETLVAQDFLIRKPNGRLRINESRPAGEADLSLADISGPRPESPDERITEHVIQLSLRGVDECLREEATASRFGIGRAVLRRILNRLSGEGMIEHLPRRGWKVRPFREREMLDYLDLREVLELHALDLTRGRLDPARLQEMLQGNTPDETGEPRLDNGLHRYWIEESENRYLQEFFQQNGVYFDALFDRAVLDRDTVARRAAEHREILQALLAEDLDRARAALASHIRDQRHHVSRLFASLDFQDQEESAESLEGEQSLA